MLLFKKKAIIERNSVVVNMIPDSMTSNITWPRRLLPWRWESRRFCGVSTEVNPVEPCLWRSRSTLHKRCTIKTSNVKQKNKLQRLRWIEVEPAYLWWEDLTRKRCSIRLRLTKLSFRLWVEDQGRFPVPTQRLWTKFPARQRRVWTGQLLPTSVGYR